jgi:hypothetical protein
MPELIVPTLGPIPSGRFELPMPNATLMKVSGGGTSEDYDSPAGSDTTKWTGLEGVYLNEATERRGGAEASSIVITRSVIVLADVSQSIGRSETPSSSTRDDAEMVSEPIRAIQRTEYPGAPGVGETPPRGRLMHSAGSPRPVRRSEAYDRMVRAIEAEMEQIAHELEGKAAAERDAPVESAEEHVGRITGGQPHLKDTGFRYRVTQARPDRIEGIVGSRTRLLRRLAGGAPRLQAHHGGKAGYLGDNVKLLIAGPIARRLARMQLEGSDRRWLSSYPRSGTTSSAQGIVRKPSVAGSLPPLWLEPRLGVPAPGEGNDPTEVGADAVIGAWTSSGIAPHTLQRRPAHRLHRHPHADEDRADCAPDRGADPRRPPGQAELADVAGMTIIETLMYRELQSLGSDEQGFDWVMTFSFERYSGLP